jgi:hypothetical protein
MELKNPWSGKVIIANTPKTKFRFLQSETILGKVHTKKKDPMYKKA